MFLKEQQKHTHTHLIHIVWRVGVAQSVAVVALFTHMQHVF